MYESNLTRDEVLALLKKFKESQRAEYKLISLGIFGSFARGDNEMESDIDIVFETDQPNLFRTARMRADLEDLLKRPVDVVRLRDRMNPVLKQRILRDVHYV